MTLAPAVLALLLAGGDAPVTPPPPLTDPADARPAATPPATTTAPADDVVRAVRALLGKHARVTRVDGGVVEGRVLSYVRGALTMRALDGEKRVMRIESVARVEPLPAGVVADPKHATMSSWTLPAVAGLGFLGGAIGGAGGCLVGCCPGAALGAAVCGGAGAGAGALGFPDARAALVVGVAAGVGGLAGGLAGFALPSAVSNTIPSLDLSAADADPGSIALTAASAGVVGGAGALVCGLAAAWTEEQLAALDE